MKKTQGFTLVELLIAIAILSILGTIVMGRADQARVKGRDAARIENVKNLRSALELYYGDFGSYPKTFEPGDTLASLATCDGVNMTSYIPGVAGVYVPTLPTDPVLDCGGVTHGWIYASDGEHYKLITHPEVGTIEGLADPAVDGGADPCELDGPDRVHYGTWTEGAKCWAL